MLLNQINAEILNNKVQTQKKVPVNFEAHGVTRVDNYYWMRDDTRENEEVISHLESENKYIESWFESGEDLRDKLFEEITDRIPKKEDSVPIRLKSYEYFRRYEPGNEHGIYIRRKNKNAKEFVLIDVNELAKDSEFYQLANWSISPNENLMAYAEDTTGRREYNIKFKDLVTGETYKKVLSDSSGDMAWSSDGKYLFYVLLATVCDVMPLRFLNRFIAIKTLNELDLNKLIAIRKIYEILERNNKISVNDLGYLIGPILNAGGRLNNSDYATILLLSLIHI